jgi:small subunit ribosomal protein S17
MAETKKKTEEKAPEAEEKAAKPEKKAAKPEKKPPKAVKTAPEAEKKAPKGEKSAPKAEEEAPEPEEKAPKAEEKAAEPEDKAPDAEELEGMDWKARRRLERSRESGEAGEQHRVEDRVAERTERRAAAAGRRRAYRGRSRERRKGSGQGTPPAERDSVERKVRQGTVVSDKADKTITVRIDIVRRHPTYEKIVRHSGTLHAHDERNEAGEGDVVRLVETRPLSKTKRWRLAEVLEKAK